MMVWAPDPSDQTKKGESEFQNRCCYA